MNIKQALKETEFDVYLKRVYADDAEFVRSAVEKGTVPQHVFKWTIANAVSMDLKNVLSYMAPLADEEAAESALFGIKGHVNEDIFLALLDKYDCKKYDSVLLQRFAESRFFFTSQTNIKELIRRSNTQAAVANLLFKGCEEQAAAITKHANKMILDGSKTLSGEERILAEISNGDRTAILTRLDNGEDMAFERLMPMRTAIMLGQNDIAEALARQTPPNQNCIGLIIRAGNEKLLETFLPIADTTPMINGIHPIEEALDVGRQDFLVAVVQHFDPSEHLVEYQKIDLTYHQRLESAVQEAALRQKMKVPASKDLRTKSTGL